MTEHFSNLSPEIQERLAILAEECAEVIQVVGKILRHGMYSCSPVNPPQPTNQALLEKELGDLKWILALMIVNDDVSLNEIDVFMQKKQEKAQPYLHHQKPISMQKP